MKNYTTHLYSKWIHQFHIKTDPKFWAPKLTDPPTQYLKGENQSFHHSPKPTMAAPAPSSDSDDFNLPEPGPQPLGDGDENDPVFIDELQDDDDEDIQLVYLTSPVGLRQLNLRSFQDACVMYCQLTAIWWWVSQAISQHGGPFLSNFHFETMFGYNDPVDSYHYSIKAELIRQSKHYNSILLKMADLFNLGKFNTKKIIKAYKNARLTLLGVPMNQGTLGTLVEDFWQVFPSISLIKIDYYCRCTFKDKQAYQPMRIKWASADGLIPECFGTQFNSQDPIPNCNSVEVNALFFGTDTDFQSWPPSRDSGVLLAQRFGSCPKCDFPLDMAMRIGVRGTTLYVVLRGKYDIDKRTKLFKDVNYLTKFQAGFWAYDFDLNKYVYFKRTWLSLALWKRGTTSGHQVTVSSFLRPHADRPNYLLFDNLSSNVHYPNMPYDLGDKESDITAAKIMAQVNVHLKRCKMAPPVTEIDLEEVVYARTCQSKPATASADDVVTDFQNLFANQTQYGSGPSGSKRKKLGTIVLD